MAKSGKRVEKIPTRIAVLPVPQTGSFFLSAGDDITVFPPSTYCSHRNSILEKKQRRSLNQTEKISTPFYIHLSCLKQSARHSQTVNVPC